MDDSSKSSEDPKWIKINNRLEKGFPITTFKIANDPKPSKTLNTPQVVTQLYSHTPVQLYTCPL